MFIINGFPFLSKVNFLSNRLNETKANQHIVTGISIVRYRYKCIHMLTQAATELSAHGVTELSAQASTELSAIGVTELSAAQTTTKTSARSSVPHCDEAISQVIK